jgi:hypothetical protein
MKKITIFILINLFFIPYLFAETILLKTGQSIEGNITERADEYIKVSFQGVDLIYYNDEIESISKKEVSLISPGKGLGFKPAYSLIDFSALAEHYPVEAGKELSEDNAYTGDTIVKSPLSVPSVMPLEANDAAKQALSENLDAPSITSGLPLEYQQIIKSIQSNPDNLSTMLSNLPNEYRIAIETTMKNIPQTQAHGVDVEEVEVEKE